MHFLVDSLLALAIVDQATGIITTADGWKLRAKMIKMKTEDGGERVVKKYVRVDEGEIQRPNSPQQLIRKRPQPKDLLGVSQLRCTS